MNANLHPIPNLNVHEDFSLTGLLLQTTSQWHLCSDLGSFGARSINLVCTPFTALIDTVAHLTLGVLTVCGLSQLAWGYNFAAGMYGSHSPFKITISGGVVNLCNGLKHLVAIVAAPLIGAADPSKAAELFCPHNNLVKQQLKKEILSMNQKLEREERAKNHVIQNAKNLKKEINAAKQKQKEQQDLIEALKQNLTNAQRKTALLAKNSKIAIQGHEIQTKTLLDKIASLEAENIRLTQENLKWQTPEEQTKPSTDRWNLLSSLL